jgi:hypothetical protein
VRKTRIPPEEGRLINGRLATWWERGGLLQTVTATFQGGYVLDLAKEWQPYEDRIRAIEVCVKGDAGTLLAACSGDDARAHGKRLRTPNGMRWWIPLHVWSKAPIERVRVVQRRVRK